MFAVLAKSSPFWGAGAKRHFLFFSSKNMLYLFCGLVRPLPDGREVNNMQDLHSLVLSVAADVISYCICNVLDRWLKGRKH